MNKEIVRIRKNEEREKKENREEGDLGRMKGDQQRENNILCTRIKKRLGRENTQA